MSMHRRSTDQTPPAFRDVIRQGRRQRGMTQRELGARVEQSESWVSHLEHGRIGMPGTETLRLLADALGISITDLFIAGEIARTQAETQRILAAVPDPTPGHDQLRTEIHRLIDGLDPRKLNYALRTVDLIARAEWGSGLAGSEANE